MLLSYLLVVVYKRKTWKQEFLVMVYISITTAFRYRGKGHLAYYMRILHVSSLAPTNIRLLALSFQPPQKGLGWAFYDSPHNAQTG